MNEPINFMLSKYQCQTEHDIANALKEIFQEIALLGLWRSKFFEKAAFYGGSALRILYGLDRFSEDLDFSLLRPDDSFSLEKYNKAITDELASFGFEADVSTKHKQVDTKVESAFIKANTKKQMLVINVNENIINRMHAMHTLKIKMEVDTEPPPGFFVESKTLRLPIPFSIISYQLPDLFAGKLHAVLCRKWQKRVKGRDWYDFVWYVARDTPVRINHLKTRMVQSGHWDASKSFGQNELVNLLFEKIDGLDIERARSDVEQFVQDKASLAIWSREFFRDTVQHIRIC